VCFVLRQKQPLGTFAVSCSQTLLFARNGVVRVVDFAAAKETETIGAHGWLWFQFAVVTAVPLASNPRVVTEQSVSGQIC